MSGRYGYHISASHKESSIPASFDRIPMHGSTGAAAAARCRCGAAQPSRGEAAPGRRPDAAAPRRSRGRRSLRLEMHAWFTLMLPYRDEPLRLFVGHGTPTEKKRLRYKCLNPPLLASIVVKF